MTSRMLNYIWNEDDNASICTLDYFYDELIDLISDGNEGENYETIPTINESNNSGSEYGHSSRTTSEDILANHSEVSNFNLDVKNSLEKVFTSKTDPMGKFLKKNNLTFKDIIDLNLENKILQCPTKQRTKYHKRKGLSADEKLKINRQRNREHAKATRIRRKIYKEVIIEY